VNKSGLIAIWIVLTLLAGGCTPSIATPTLAPTPAQNLISPAPTLEPSPTLTPFPTSSPTPFTPLSESEWGPYIEKIETTDYPCDLPCFANMIPGETTWLQVKEFWADYLLSPGASSHSTYIRHWVGLPTAVENKPGFSIGISTDYKHVIRFISTRRYNYSMSDAFEKYGVPDQINFMVTDTWPVESHGSYQFILWYERGFMFMYETEHDQGDTLLICPEAGNVHSPELGIWDPADELTFEKIQQQNLVGALYAPRHYHPVDEVFGISLKDFTEAVIADPNACFTISNPDLYYLP